MSNNDNPARKKFEPMLSPFVDGELTPEERLQVEQHLAANKESAMQVADFRAASGLMRLKFEQQADQEDWKDFSNQVLAKLTPEKAPLFERLKTSLSEMFTYQRRMFVGAMVTAGLMVTVGSLAFLMGSSKGAGYANEQLQLQTVKVDQGSHVAPVVMETENGDAIIWMVDSPDKDKDNAQEKKDEKKKGEESEEVDPDPAAPKKAGDLLRALAAVAVAVSALPALADEPKVAVQVEVVHALLTGNTIDPPTLKAMQDALGKKVKYGSLKRLSMEKLNLESKPSALKLPNGVEATLAVEGLKDDVATLRVKVPPADATYKLGKKGSLYVQAGAHEGGDLWLVLSPAK